jgi:Transglycosylase SLT domain.
MREKELRALAAQMAERYGLDPAIFTRMIETESSFNPNARNARTGGHGPRTGYVGHGPRSGVRCYTSARSA